MNTICNICQAAQFAHTSACRSQLDIPSWDGGVRWRRINNAPDICPHGFTETSHPVRTAPAHTPCRHLQADTGQTTACVELNPDGSKRCGNGTLLKVFGCELFGMVTLARLGEGLTKCCKIGDVNQCPQYQPKETP